MKKLLLIAALAAATFNSYAQDCSSIVSSSGGMKTQLQKATSESANKLVSATLWLSRDNNGYYLHISPVVKADNKPFNIKGLPGERIQLTYTDGNTFNSQLIKSTGTEAIVMLSQDMVNALATLQVESVTWFENGTMEPSLQLIVNDMANQKLAKAASCLGH